MIVQEQWKRWKAKQGGPQKKKARSRCCVASSPLLEKAEKEASGLGLPKLGMEATTTRQLR